MTNEEALNEKFNKIVTDIETSTRDGDFPFVLTLIDDIEDFDSFTADKKNQILNYKVKAALKIEDYNLLLNALNDKKKLLKVGTIDPNILFYEAIAYEALDEVNLAIEYLNNIIDNIPRHSLINKYLKLALLYAKIGDVKKASESYNYASQVDFNHTNEMFSLVESDLYYLSNKYEESLISFEDFFRKSSNKYKYIDRYILIEIKLNHLEEAYTFYTAYKNKQGIILSSQNKYRFYKASLELLKLLNKEDEAREVIKELENIKPHYALKEEKENLKIISMIEKMSLMPISKNDSPKNLVLKYYKALKELCIKHLFYVSETPTGYSIYEALDTRMREKGLSFDEIKEKNLEEYILNDFSLKDHYINYYLERIEEDFISLNLYDEYHNFGKIVLSYDQDKEYIYEALKNSLFSLFLRLDSIKKDTFKYESLLDMMSLMNYGILLFSDNMIHLLNDKAKDILENKTSLINFEYFLTLSKEDIFVDTLKKKKSIIKFEINSKEKQIEFIPYENNGTLFTLIRDVSNTINIEKEKDDFLKRSGTKFYNAETLKEYVAKRNESYALIGLTINMVSAYDSLSIRSEKLDQLYKFLIQESPSSSLFYLGENHYIILMNNTDKRVIESLYKSIARNIKQLYKTSTTLRDENISAFATKALKNKTWSDVEEILEYGFFLSNKRDDFIFIDSEEKKKYALYKTYEIELIRLLKEESLKIEYIPIIDKDNVIHYFIPKFILPFNMDQRTFESIININHLESKADQVMCNVVFNDLKEFNKDIRVIINIHKETIFNDNFVKKCSVLFKKSNLDNKVVFNIDNLSQDNYVKNVKSLQNSGIKFAGLFSTFSDLDTLDRYSILFMNFDAANNLNLSIAKSIKENKDIEIVLFDTKTDFSLTLNSKVKSYTKEEMLKL